MQKIFEDFFDLFFPGTDKEGEEDPLWLKILAMILLAGIVGIVFLFLS